LERLGRVICAIAFDLCNLSLLALGCGAKRARFADGERCGVDCGWEVESSKAMLGCDAQEAKRRRVEGYEAYSES